MDDRLPMPQPCDLIDGNRGLTDLIDRLYEHEIVAVDTESDSYHAYAPKVCLFQFSTSSEDALLDPLGDIDLGPLGDFFRDPKIEKVFHAAENDIGMLGHQYGFEFHNIFDTMLASQILGYARCGLATLLETHFNVKMTKKWQTSNWAKRPLLPEQIEYATLDTHYLLPLRDRLSDELHQRGTMEEAQSEFERVSAIQWSPRPFDPEGFSRLRESRHLDPIELRRLQELYLLRDRLARDRNWAPYRIFPDGAMVELARLGPKGLVDLEKVKALKSWKIKSMGPEIVEAIERARRAGPLELAKNRPRAARSAFSPSERRRIEVLKRWRDIEAEERDVPKERVLTSGLIHQISRLSPPSRESLLEVDGMTPWRVNEFGIAILDALAKADDEE